MDDEDNLHVMTRRRALGLGSAVGLGALLAACQRGSDAANGTPSATSGGAVSSAPTSAASLGSPGAVSAPASVSASAAMSTAGADIVTALNAAGTCKLVKEEIQGPYYFDVDFIRSDVREDRKGTKFQLAMRVQNVTGCAAGGAAKAMPNTVVEIWQCDAEGIYSGFEAGSKIANSGTTPNMSNMPMFTEYSDGSYAVGDPEAATTDTDRWLRGAQVADANGIVQFTTIYPGWYLGRTMHFHIKVHQDKHTMLTSQLYIDDAITAEAYKVAPYSARQNRDTLNQADAYFDPSSLLAVSKHDDGYLGVINLGLDV